MRAIPQIVGVENVVAWFGYWPSFHDSKILEIHLSRSERSWISIHAWSMTSEVDAKGYYILDKHAVVKFEFRNVQDQDVELAVLGPQQVLNSLIVEPLENSFLLTMDPCYGPSGSIMAEHVFVGI